MGNLPDPTEPEEETKNTHSTKDRWFDHWLIAKNNDLKEIINDVITQVTTNEVRGRRRKNKDKLTFEKALAALVTNACYLVANPSATGKIAISLDNNKTNTRYEHPLLAKSTLKKALKALNNEGIVVHHDPESIRKVSTFSDSKGMRGLVLDRGVSTADFMRDPEQEPIVLTQTLKQWAVDKDGPKPRKNVKWRDYKNDDEATYAFRQQMRRLNSLLQNSNISFIDDGLGVVDSQNRVMRRHFSLLKGQAASTWDQNGRLFGGFWQSLKKTRRAGIRIDGEPICDLDFKNAFARLAYLHVGKDAPEGDLYDLTGRLEGFDLEHPTHRDGVKTGFNSLLFGGAAAAQEIIQYLPQGTTGKTLKEALKAKHPDLVPVFSTMLGFKLMFTESQILMNTLVRLMDQGIVALPMHDGIMVGSSHKVKAEIAMRAACIDVVGAELVVVPKIDYGATIASGAPTDSLGEILGVGLPAVVKAAYGPPEASRKLASLAEGLLAA